MRPYGLTGIPLDGAVPTVEAAWESIPESCADIAAVVVGMKGILDRILEDDVENFPADNSDLCDCRADGDLHEGCHKEVFDFANALPGVVAWDFPEFMVDAVIVLRVTVLTPKGAPVFGVEYTTGGGSDKSVFVNSADGGEEAGFCASDVPDLSSHLLLFCVVEITCWISHRDVLLGFYQMRSLAAISSSILAEAKKGVRNRLFELGTVYLSFGRPCGG